MPASLKLVSGRGVASVVLQQLRELGNDGLRVERRMTAPDYVRDVVLMLFVADRHRECVVPPTGGIDESFVLDARARRQL
jgi:hypothetical protein